MPVNIFESVNFLGSRGKILIFANRCLANENELKEESPVSHSPETQSNAPFPSAVMTQVAVIVRDIERSSKAYAELFGLPVPSIIETAGFDEANTHYRGQPTEARAKLAFFNVGSLQLELIEPIGGPSTWQEFLDEHGEGIHHIAFGVKGMDDVLVRLEQNGIPTVQRGDYKGGRYSYVDGHPAGLGGGD